MAAVNRLQRMGLARKEHYGTVSLTIEGLAIAREMETRFELLRIFFTRILGTDSRTSALDACNIEHIISKQSISRIKKMVLSL